MIPFFMTRILSILLLLSSGSLLGQAYAHYNKGLQRAFALVVDMRFEEAGDLVQREKKQQPENRAADYLEAAMICIELFVNEDSREFENRQEQIDNAVDRIEELPDEEPFRHLFLGELYTAQAILNGKFKNNLTAAWQFYKAYDYLTTNYREFPDFKPTYIPLGVMYAAIGSLPDEYRSMASLLGFEGSVEQGMLMLRQAYTSLSADPELQFYRPYAGFVYSYADYQLGADPSLSPQKLGLQVASSSFLIYLQALYEVQQGHPRQASAWLRKRPSGPQYLDFEYLYYLEGKILLGLDADRAKQQFETYLELSKSDLYLKSTYRYLSWYYLLKGNDQKAGEMREMVYRRGSENTGADRQAVVENQHPLNAVLIEARLLFDAARYPEALQILESQTVSTCCPSSREQVEYYYRKGRIFESTADTAQAISAFRQAMNVKDAQASYALGNTALQLGLLYEETGKSEQARSWYRRSLRISKYPFYEGVHQKAKAGLSRLRN